MCVGWGGCGGGLEPILWSLAFTKPGGNLFCVGIHRICLALSEQEVGGQVEQ